MKNTWAMYKTFGGFCVYEIRNAENTRAAVVRNYGREKELTTYYRKEARGEWSRLRVEIYDTVKEAKDIGAGYVGAI